MMTKWSYTCWWLMANKFPECRQLVTNLKVWFSDDSEYDEQIISWFRSKPGLAWPGATWAEAPGELGYETILQVLISEMWASNSAHWDPVKHKMVNIRTCLFLFSSSSPVSNCYCCVKFQLSFFVFVFWGHLHILCETVLSWIFFLNSWQRLLIVTLLLASRVLSHVCHFSEPCQPLFFLVASPWLLLSAPCLALFSPDREAKSDLS